MTGNKVVFIVFLFMQCTFCCDFNQINYRIEKSSENKTIRL